MAANPAEQYLTSLANDPNARKRLHDAVAGDIVAAGKAAGYVFTEEQLNAVMDPSGGGASPERAGTVMGWNNS